VTGNPVGPSQFSEDITLDDVAASLRLEQGEVAAALIKARDSLQEQARLQQLKEAKQAAAAAAAEAAERAKPKVGCNSAQLTRQIGSNCGQSDCYNQIDHADCLCLHILQSLYQLFRKAAVMQ